MYSIAQKEFYRTQGLSAFNVMHSPTKHKLNQHAVKYKFSDNSVLIVYTTTNHMVATDANGQPMSDRVLFGGNRHVSRK